MKTFFILLLLFLGSCSGNNFQTTNLKSDEAAQGVYSSKVDVLWMVDTSYTTMSNHQNRISNKMSGFYEGLIKNKADFRIVATTLDMSASGEKGELVEGGLVVSPESKNPISDLKKLLKRGGNGSSQELGLEAMEAALNKEKSSYSENKFLREDALLVIVFLSDEEDLSLGKVSYYKNYLDGLKGKNTSESKKWIVNYIGITDTSDPDCTTYGDYSEKGNRYIELANISGGVTESICKSDFSSFVNQISVRLKSVINQFFLKHIPLLDSLTVKKNAVFVRKDAENGWTYDEEKNAVTLHGSSKPQPKDKIEIDYEIKRIIKQ